MSLVSKVVGMRLGFFGLTNSDSSVLVFVYFFGVLGKESVLSVGVLRCYFFLVVFGLFIVSD